MNRDQVNAVAAILKEKFSNLTVMEVVDLSFRIVEAVEQRDARIPPPSSFGEVQR